MLFSSFPFLMFIVVVFALFYFPFKGNIKWQNWLLLIASYFFYGYADLKMIPLLLFSTTFFYFLAKILNKSSNDKKSGLLTNFGVVIGVGLLLYFKYFNFVIASVNDLFVHLNITQAHWRGFNIIMPLGISFFTFKLISYIVEVNRGKMEPINDFVAFAVYTSFFPTIMSGPIDRPNAFLPQLKKYRSFDYNLAIDGCRQILWGAFQKMVIADNLATYTSYAWNHIETSNGSTLLLAAILFSFQMYTDFSGYSDMAIGIGKVFGFNVVKNFNYPFFATNIAEYWRRWHMSLTSWLTDYVFMPLNISFRNLGRLGITLAIIINMVLVGIWHGANWTFAVFGLYHGLLFIPLIISGSFMKRKKLKTTEHGFPVFFDLVKMVWIFILVTIGLVIFNSKNLEQAYHFFKGVFDVTLFTLPKRHSLGFASLFFLVFFFLIEWIYRKDEFAVKNIGYNWNVVARRIVYYIFICITFYFSARYQQFLYMRF